MIITGVTKTIIKNSKYDEHETDGYYYSSIQIIDQPITYKIIHDYGYINIESLDDVLKFLKLKRDKIENIEYLGQCGIIEIEEWSNLALEYLKLEQA